MPAPFTIIVGVIVTTIALVAVFMVRPSVTMSRPGKVLAFLSLFILPIATASLGVAEHIDHSKKTEFCLSCHVMEPYGKSLKIDDRAFLPAVHYQNHMIPQEKACFTCHTDYTMYGDVAAKLRGLKHVWVYYVTGPPKEVKLYSKFNNRECLHCHENARSFREGATHTDEEGKLGHITSGKMSCLSADCHPSVHDVKHLGEQTMWEEAK